MERGPSARQWEDAAARERVETLLGLARVALEQGEEKLSKRYVFLARKIAMRHRLKIGSDRFCKSCNQVFVGGAFRTRIIKGRPFRVCVSCQKKRAVGAGRPENAHKKAK